MPLEIVLHVPGVIIKTIDGNFTAEILADFGPLVVTASYGTPKGKYDPLGFPFTITHRATGLLVNCFPSLDLASCAAREWSRYDWSINVNAEQRPATPDDSAKCAELYKRMTASTIYKFSGHKEA